MNDEIEKLKKRIARLEANERKLELLKAALSESEASIKSIIENSPDAIFLADKEGNYLQVNRAAVRMLGYKRAELLRLNVRDIRMAEGLPDSFQKLLKTGRIFKEITLRKKDGSTIEVELNAVVLSDGLVYGSCRDISERKKAAKAIEESEFKFRKIFDADPNIRILADIKSKTIVSVNKAYCRMMGYKPSEVVNKPGKLGFLIPDQKQFEAASRKIQKFNSLNNYEITVVNKKGGELHFLVFAEPIEIGGRHLHIITASDITKQKEIEQELILKSSDLDDLYKIANAVSKTLDLNRILQLISEKAAKLLKLETSAIYLLEDGRLYLGATTPPLPADVPKIARYAELKNHPHIKKALTTRKPVILKDTQTEKLTEQEKTIVEMRNLRSLLYVPLMMGKESIGILIIGYSESPGIFSKRDIELSRSLADHSGLAIANAKLLKNLKTANTELNEEIKKRKLAAETLQESENKFRTLTVSSNVGLFLDDADGKAIYLNDKCAELVGLPAEKALELNWAPSIHPDDRERVVREWGKTIKSGAEFHEIYRWVHSDGKVVWTKGDIVPVKGADGKVDLFIGSLTDVTEQKKAELSLRMSELRYRELADSITDVFFALDDKLNISFWNDASEKLTGVKAKDAVGKSLYKIYKDFKGTISEKTYNEALKTNKPKRVIQESRLHNKNYFFEINAYPSKSGLSVFIKDITAAKKAEDNFIKQVELNKQLLDTTMDGYILADDKGNIIEVNPAYCRIVKYSRKELLKMNILQLEAKLNPEELNKLIASMLKAGSAKFETMHFDKNGNVIDLEVSISIIKMDDRQLVAAFVRDISERKSAEEEMIENENLLLKAQSVSRMGFLKWDLKSSSIELSDEIIFMYGLEAEQKWATPELVAKIVHPDDLEMVGENLDMAVKGIKKYNVDHRVVRPDGKILWVHAQADLIYDDDGNPQSLLGTAIDITDRKKAEFALHESEQRWQFALEGSGDGVWDWNAVTNEVYYSKRWKEMLGFSDEEIGNSLEEWDKRIHPDDKEQCYADLEKHFTGKTDIYLNEHRVRCKDGSYKWILDRGKVISRTEDKKPLRVIGTHSDITERKRAEKEIIEHRQKLSSMLNNTPMGAIFYDLDLRITEWNKSAERIFGFSREEALGKHPFELIVPNEIQDSLKGEVVNKLVSGTGGESSVNENLTKNKKRILCRWYNSSITDINGKVSGVASLVADITEQDRIKKELEKHRKHLEELVKARTKELEDKNKKLKEFNKLFVGREFRIKQLRDQVEELKEKLNKLSGG